MLTLVISTPVPTVPSDRASARLEWRAWIDALARSGEVRMWAPRVGRGAVAVFDLPSNEVLHERLTVWAAFVPAHFDLYPLVDPDAHMQALQAIRERAAEGS